MTCCQPEASLERQFHKSAVLVGCNLFSFLALKMGEEATQFKSASHLQLSTSTHDDLGSMEMSEKRATDTCGEPRVAMASEPTVLGTCAQTQSDLSMRNVHNAPQSRGQGMDVLFETCRDCCHYISLFLYKSFLLEHRTCART